MSLFAELKRRNVIRVAVAYLVASWLLIEGSSLILDIYKAPDWVSQVIVALLGLGFPVVLVFSWVFEMTPDGLKRESEIAPSEAVSAHTARKLDIAVIVLLVMAMGLFGVDRLTRSSETVPVVAEAATTVEEPVGPHELSIAVLPFVNMSADADNEYFADGLSEELLNVLAKIEDFKVAGRTSSFAFKGQDQDLRIIGEKLDVATVLEGSVRKSGDRVRITAQLVKTDDGYHLWSETYDRELDDIFAIQDDIAGQVVAALKTTLLGQDQATIAASTTTTNVEAYQHLLRARSIIKSRTKVDLERAMQELDSALELDPDYALAYAVRGETLWHLNMYGYWPLSEVEPELERSVERALALDPGLPEAYAARFMLQTLRNAPLEEQVESLERAVELNPNYALARIWLAGVVVGNGDLEWAYGESRRAVELDPLHPVILRNHAYYAAMTGRRADAQRMLDALGSLDPSGNDVLDTQSVLAWIEGDFVGQVRPRAQLLERAPEDMISVMTMVNFALTVGDTETSDRWIARGLEINPENLNLLDSQVRSALFEGDHEAARTAYRRADSATAGAALRRTQLVGSALELFGAEAAWGLCAEGLGIEDIPRSEEDIPEFELNYNVWDCTLALRNLGEGVAAELMGRRGLEKIAEQGSSWPPAQSARLSAILHSALGDRDALVDGLERLLEINPDAVMYRGWALGLDVEPALVALYPDDEELRVLVDRLHANAMQARRELAAEGILTPPPGDEG